MVYGRASSAIFIEDPTLLASGGGTGPSSSTYPCSLPLAISIRSSYSVSCPPLDSYVLGLKVLRSLMALSFLGLEESRREAVGKSYIVYDIC